MISSAIVISLMVVFVLVGRFLRALSSLAKHAESRPISAYERKAQISGEAAKFNARGWPQESSERRWQGQGHSKRFRFLNAEQVGTIRAVQRFNPFPLAGGLPCALLGDILCLSRVRRTR
jgi:hypothetical protein